MQKWSKLTLLCKCNATLMALISWKSVDMLLEVIIIPCNVNSSLKEILQKNVSYSINCFFQRELEKVKKRRQERERELEEREKERVSLYITVTTTFWMEYRKEINVFETHYI